MTAVDPHAGNDRGPQEIEGSRAEGQADHEAFLANLERAGVRDRVRHVRLPASEALGGFEGTADLLYVDGAHRYAPARDDIDGWGRRSRSGAHCSSTTRSRRSGSRWRSSGCSSSAPGSHTRGAAARWPSTARRDLGPGARRQRRPPTRAAALVRAQRAREGGARHTPAAPGARARSPDDDWPY